MHCHVERVLGLMLHPEALVACLMVYSLMLLLLLPLPLLLPT